MTALRHNESSSPLERLPARLAELLRIKDPQQRLAKLVHDAPKLPLLDPPLRIDAHRVEGCLVRLWFVPELRNGKCFFRCDSDAVSLRAVGGLLCELYSGRTPEEIAASSSGCLKHLGLLHQLAENRRRTIARLEELIHRFALAHRAQALESGLQLVRGHAEA